MVSQPRRCPSTIVIEPSCREQCGGSGVVLSAARGAAEALAAPSAASPAAKASVLMIRAISRSLWGLNAAARIARD
jgi:hypothetical protein